MNRNGMTSNGKVCIGIVTYNSEPYITACIDSTLRQSWKNLQVILLDNASHDATVDTISQSFKSITIVQSRTNLGFAKGHNRIISMTDADFYLPLNPDLILEHDYVERMMEAISSARSVGWVSGRLFFMTKTLEKTNRLYTTGHLIYRNGMFGNRGYGTFDNGSYDTAEEVFGANGAAPLYAMQMLQDIAPACNGQYLDESYFLPGSDTELDWRARLLGWQCIYNPAAIGFHVEHGSISMSDPCLQREWVRRRYMLVLKCAFLRDIAMYYLPMLVIDIILACLQGKKTTLSAIAELPSHLPNILIKRRQLVKRRRVSRNEITGWMLPTKMNFIYEF